MDEPFAVMGVFDLGGISAPEAVGVSVAAILTLVVFSYLWRDNAAYRLAEHVFIGTTIGYVFVVAYHQVIYPKLLGPGISGAYLDWRLLIPGFLGLSLLLRQVRSLSWVGNWGIAFVVGAGSALALGGAVAGTLLPQVMAAAPALAIAREGMDWSLLIGNVVLLVGVVTTLSYFCFTSTRRSLDGRLLGSAGWMGKWMMMVAFGALFASLTTSRLSLLVGRLYFLLGDWLGLVR